MGIVVIAPYRVKKEKQHEFFAVIKEKRIYFLANGYMTARTPILLQSRIDNEVLLDIFEWTSEKHIDKAHEDKRVRNLWNEMAGLWEDGGFNLEELKESGMSFPNFIPVDL